MELGPNQKRWINELKSGNYNQCYGRLRSSFDYNLNESPSFCCLGVANAVLNLRETSVYEMDNTYKQLGLRSPNGELLHPYSDGNRKYLCLTELNDSHTLSFKQIAEYIEANPENVFAESK